MCYFLLAQSISKLLSNYQFASRHSFRYKPLWIAESLKLWEMFGSPIISVRFRFFAPVW